MFHVAWWLMRQEGQLLKTHVPVYVVTMLWWVSAAGGGSIRRVCSLLRASDVRERRSMRSRVRVVWAGGGEGQRVWKWLVYLVGVSTGSCQSHLGVEGSSGLVQVLLVVAVHTCVGVM